MVVCQGEDARGRLGGCRQRVHVVPNAVKPPIRQINTHDPPMHSSLGPCSAANTCASKGCNPKRAAAAIACKPRRGRQALSRATLLMLPLLWPIAAAFAAILLIGMLQRAFGSAAKPAGVAAPSRRSAFWRRPSAAARCG